MRTLNYLYLKKNSCRIRLLPATTSAARTWFRMGHPLKQYTQ